VRVSAGLAMEASEARGTAWPKVRLQALCVTLLEPVTPPVWYAQFM